MEYLKAYKPRELKKPQDGKEKGIDSGNAAALCTERVQCGSGGI